MMVRNCLSITVMRLSKKLLLNDVALLKLVASDLMKKRLFLFKNSLNQSTPFYWYGQKLGISIVLTTLSYATHFLRSDRKKFELILASNQLVF